MDFAENRDLKADSTLSKFARAMMAPFFDEEPDLFEKLEAICQDALNFPAPIRRLDSKTSVLELFHGPTLAFKDVGARFLALQILELDESNCYAVTILRRKYYVACDGAS